MPAAPENLSTLLLRAPDRGSCAVLRVQISDLPSHDPHVLQHIPVSVLLFTPLRGARDRSWAGSASRQRGFSLLEVLIAMFVLLVGLLALAGLQARTLSQTRDTEIRSLVALQAESLAEAMRANPLRQLDANGATVLSWEHYVESGYASHDASAPANSCRDAAGCSQQNLAALDLWAFKSGLASGLAAGNAVQAAVCRGSAAPSQDDPGCSGSGPLSIRVVWSSRLDGKSRQALVDSGQRAATASSPLAENRYVLVFEP
ncbi:type IV pilus modification protein PilV [Pseudogulbenkiania sp. NH8B]|uniref:type IV pilus modification protein PilV n=1 Tax=Pseudogulbenkiania sp. (strain NH8B) TaxID=748280 RepID=UPI0011D255E0|nr:type IV pilus modification protein PilV [Pseudogulbenkiania sp. NH8B]